MSYTIAKTLAIETRPLEELVPAEQLEVLDSIMKDWAGELYKPFDGEIDKDKIADHIGWMYATKTLQAPKIIFTYNPVRYKSLVSEIIIGKKDTAVDINMKGYLSEMLRMPTWLTVNTEDRINRIEIFLNSFKNIIARLPFNNIDKFRDFIAKNPEARNAATTGAWGNPSSVRPSRNWLVNALLNHMFNGYGLWSDSSWFFLFDFMSATGIRNDKVIDKYRAVLKTGVFCSMFFRNNAVVLIRPKITRLSPEKQLHCDGGEAIQWRDSFKTYVLHNVPVPEHLALTPHHELDPTLVVKEKNAEIRKEIVRKIGVERLITHFGAVVIDSHHDYELIELTLKEINVTGRYLKMISPSIGTWHVEGVPPHIETCLEALKWRIGGIPWRPHQLA